MVINVDKMREKLENIDNRGKKSSKNNDFFKPEIGEQEIRFLPSDDGDPFKEYWFHYNVGTSVMCPKRNFGEKCPICDYASSLWQEGTDEGKKMAKDLFARQRFFSNVVVRGKESEGPKPYGYGKELYKKLIKVVIDPDYGDITDIDNGRDVKLMYEKGGGASFPSSDITVKPVTKPLAKTKKEIKEILDKVRPVDSFFERKTPPEVALILEHFLADPFDNDGQKKYGNNSSNSTKESSSSTVIKDVDAAIDELEIDGTGTDD